MYLTRLLSATLLLILLLLQCLLESSAASSSTHSLRLRAPISILEPAHAASSLSPYSVWADNDDDEEEDVQTPLEQFVSTCYGAATILYGSVLLLYSNLLKDQIHVITMMRATGFHKIQTAIQKARRNVRDAKWSAIRNAPSFLQAKISYRSLHERIHDLRNIQKTTRRARQDGIITKREELRLQQLRKREIQRYQRELKRLKNVGTSLSRIWNALDVDEIQDAGRAFLFQLVAVLSTGNNETFMAKLLSKWCLFLNLGDLFLSTNAKLRYPISKALVYHKNPFSSCNVTEQQASTIEATGQVLMFSSAGYLVLNHNETASALNAAAVSSAIIFRGICKVVETFWDPHDDNSSVWSTGAGFLQGYTGGVLFVGLTAVGMWCRKRKSEGKQSWNAPKWLIRPFLYIEELIDKLVVIMDKIV